jgi:DnaJ-class molecular chaperone
MKIKNLWNEMMTCPCCKGEGGETDYIIYVGIGGGPYYECPYCKGSGRVNIFKVLLWKKSTFFEKPYKIKNKKNISYLRK